MNFICVYVCVCARIKYDAPFSMIWEWSTEYLVIQRKQEHLTEKSAET